MKTFNIELINIGRDDYSETIVCRFMTKKTAYQFAVDEASKHLLSKDVSMAEDKKNNNTFIVFAGVRTVGKVRITEVDDE